MKEVSLRVLCNTQRVIGAKQDIKMKESAILLNALHGRKLALRHCLEHQQIFSKLQGSGLSAMEVKPESLTPMPSLLILAIPSLVDLTTDANIHTYCREAGGFEDGFDLVDLHVSIFGLPGDPEHGAARDKHVSASEDEYL